LHCFRSVLPGRFLALLFLALAISAIAQPVPTDLFSGLKWRLIGPIRGGRVVAVAGVPGDSTTFYFGAINGGIWDLAISSGNPQLLFAGTWHTHRPPWSTYAPIDRPRVVASITRKMQARRGLGPTTKEFPTAIGDALELMLPPTANECTHSFKQKKRVCTVPMMVEIRGCSRTLTHG